jgi:hypothetical protein
MKPIKIFFLLKNIYFNSTEEFQFGYFIYGKIIKNVISISNFTKDFFA